MDAIPSRLATALAVTLTFASAPWAAAQDKPATPPAAPAAAAPANPAQAARADVLAELKEAREKLLALAEAIPAEKYGWRPAEGIRSVGEVFAHVAGANFFIPRAWGAQPDTAGMDVRGMQKNATDKAKVVAALRQSFDEAEKAIGQLSPADLDRQIDLFGSKYSVRRAVLIMVSHGHEHLGQSIAYARSNGITPPWSASEGG
jgi:uncharacterized damage-inducible protein DinB